MKASSGNRLGGPLTGIDVPTLRDVWATAPYLHDGSAWTLEAAVQAHTNLTLNGSDLLTVTQYLREIGSDEPAPPEMAATGTGLNGSYFNNRTLSGSAVLTRTEAINFSWGGSSPGAGVGSKNFSVRWDGFFVAPSTGTYRFQTNTDGGVRLWVSSTSMISNWAVHKTAIDTSGGVNLLAGSTVPIRLEYFDQGGSGVMQLRWSTPGNTDFVAIPATQLSK